MSTLDTCIAYATLPDSLAPIRIKVRKLTDVGLLREACAATVRGLEFSTMTLDEGYCCEHSPIRTQMFWIQMLGIPTSVSVHLVRHKQGLEPFVQSNRPDRGGTADAGRNTPVDHSLIANAQALINVSLKRLCAKAAADTLATVMCLKNAVRQVDPDLAKYMVPQCVYRGGVCPERKPCGRYRVRKYNPVAIFEDMIGVDQRDPW